MGLPWIGLFAGVEDFPGMTTVHVHSVPCLTCGANAGENCRAGYDLVLAEISPCGELVCYHFSRFTAASNYFKLPHRRQLNHVAEYH